MAVKDEEEREDKDDVSERGAETDEETNASEGEDQREDRVESSSGQHEEDEEQWKKYQEEAKKEQQLDTKVKESHPVHCPYYGEVSVRNQKEIWISCLLFILCKINNKAVFSKDIIQQFNNSNTVWKKYWQHIFVAY